MTTASAPRPFPAFRLQRGDVVRHNNRKAVVRNVEPVVFYPRSRTSGRTVDHGVRLTLRVGKATTSTTVTLRNSETISTYR